jgi:hypothetical protein
VVAHRISEDHGDNAAFLRELVDRDYDPEICPWIESNCSIPIAPSAIILGCRITLVVDTPDHHCGPRSEMIIANR